MSEQKKVLIIEDDQFVRDVYVEMLTDNGIAVDTAPDGVEGLAKILEGGYDLILLDLVMPRLDGIGVLKGLQTKTPKVTNGSIVVLSNLIEEAKIIEAKNLGAKAYIVKSDLDPSQFVEKVKSFL